LEEILSDMELFSFLDEVEQLLHDFHELEICHAIVAPWSYSVVVTLQHLSC